MKDINQQPGISFDGIILINNNFSRVADVPDSLKINIEFNMSINNHDDSFSNELTTIINCSHPDTEETVLSLECTFVGMFSVIPGEGNMNIKEFMKVNSPAIMFPYIREHVTNITLKSGISPILLPPVNIIAMTKDIEINLD